MNLEDITDIFIDTECVKNSRAWSAGNRIDAESNSFIAGLAEQLLSECKDLELIIGTDEYLLFQEQQYRVHCEKSKASTVFVLRRLPKFVPSLTQENPEGISFPDVIPELVDRHSEKAGGLFLISGPLGVGKTTLAAAVLTHLISEQGGVGWALEDPPEYDLEGEYGPNGFCYQRHVKDGDFGEAMRSMMRCFPAKANSTLFVGEIRDSKAAFQVLQSLLNGARVIFTFHSGSTTDTITRFLTLCSESKFALDILADSLRLIINISRQASLGASTRLHYSFLEGDMKTQAAIRAGQFKQLVDLQKIQTNQRISSQRLSSQS